MNKRIAALVGAGPLVVLLAVGRAATAGAAEQPSPPSHPGGDAPGSWNWPLQLRLPESVQSAYPSFKLRPGEMPILVWTPPQARRVRAVLLIMQNTDSMGFGAHKALREMAARRQVGVVYLRFGVYVHDHVKRPERDISSIQAIVDRISERTGIVEYRHTPWIPFGKSSVGRFPAYIAWNFPQRTLASIVYHGEVPPWGPPNWPPEWARFDGQALLHINVNGETEWGGAWYRHVRPGLLNFRAQKRWLPHQVVAYGIGHGDYPESTSGKDNPAERMSRLRIWDYLALFLDKAIQARLPKDVYPTDGPIELKKISDADGYCIDPRAVEELLGIPYKPLVAGEGGYAIEPYRARSPASGEPTSENPRGLAARQLIRKATDVPAADRSKMLWVPGRELAEAWFRLHAIKGQRFDGP